jgi:hypothetical protein
MKNDELDRWIACALERAEEEAPDHARDAVRRRLAAMETAKPFPWRRIVPWLPLAAAAALLVAFSLRVMQPPPAPEKRITRIRTEFELPGKNIRIIWEQRDDFRLEADEG